MGYCELCQSDFHGSSRRTAYYILLGSVAGTLLAAWDSFNEKQSVDVGTVIWISSILVLFVLPTISLLLGVRYHKYQLYWPFLVLMVIYIVGYLTVAFKYLFKGWELVLKKFDESSSSNKEEKIPSVWPPLLIALVCYTFSFYSIYLLKWIWRDYKYVRQNNKEENNRQVKA